MDWSKTSEQLFETGWYNGRLSIFINKSTKHTGWIVGIVSPSDGYTIVNPRVRSEVDAVNIAKMLMEKTPEEFHEYYMGLK